MIFFMQGTLVDSDEGPVTKKMLKRWAKSPQLCMKVLECYDVMENVSRHLAEVIFSYNYSVLSGRNKLNNKYKPKGFSDTYSTPNHERFDNEKFVVSPISSLEPDSRDSLSTPLNFYVLEYTLSETGEEILTTVRNQVFGIESCWLLMCKTRDQACFLICAQAQLCAIETLLSVCFQTWIMIASFLKKKEMTYHIDMQFYCLGIESPYWTKNKIKTYDGDVKSFELWERRNKKFAQEFKAASEDL